jgi:hypothetical protein
MTPTLASGSRTDSNRDRNGLTHLAIRLTATALHGEVAASELGLSLI